MGRRLRVPSATCASSTLWLLFFLLFTEAAGIFKDGPQGVNSNGERLDRREAEVFHCNGHNAWVHSVRTQASGRAAVCTRAESTACASAPNFAVLREGEAGSGVSLLTHWRLRRVCVCVCVFKGLVVFVPPAFKCVSSGGSSKLPIEVEELSFIFI